MRRYPCLRCNKFEAAYKDTNGNRKRLCATCARLEGTYSIQHPCRACNLVEACYRDEDGSLRLCAPCAKAVGSHERRNLCTSCHRIQACYKDEDGNLNSLCAKCAKNAGTYQCINPCSNCFLLQGSAKYDYYCAGCFRQKFPEDPRSKKVKYEHTKELMVRDKILEHFDGFVHDQVLWTGHCDCTHRRRVDFRKLIGNTILAIETDEFAHRRYDQHDEEIRYDDLYMIHSGKWMFIRFNPDGKGPEMEERLEALIQEMYFQIDRIENEQNEELLEIVKMFY